MGATDCPPHSGIGFDDLVCPGGGEEEEHESNSGTHHKKEGGGIYR